MSDDHQGQTLEVLLYGLNLHDRIGRGERPHLGTEQARLKALLGSDREPPPWGSGSDVGGSIAPGADSREFLGIRYALTCWLDETFAGDWREWDNNKLESALYRTQLRYSNFWQQAKLTEAVPSAAGAQEAFLLCVLLGFRGELGEDPERLQDWVHAYRARVARRLGRELPPLPEKTPVSDVPPLTGADRYRRMTRLLVGTILFGVPLASFLVVVYFS